MPAKINPRDWDRLFRPGAPRRGGPLRALANVLIALLVIGIIGGGAIFGLQYGVRQRQASATAQAEQVATGNAATFATRTARALSQASSASTAAPTGVPTAAAILGNGSVLAAGNLRSEPRVATDTVLGQICISDAIAFLEQQTVDGGVWYRIRVTQTAADCTPQRVPAGTEGWASSTLLSAPTP